MRLLRPWDIWDMMKDVSYAKVLELLMDKPYVKIDRCYYISDINYDKYFKQITVTMSEDMDETLSTKAFASETGLKYRTALATIKALPHTEDHRVFYIKRQTMYDYFAASEPITIKTERPKKAST